MNIETQIQDYLDRCILYAYRGSHAHGMYVPPTDPTSIDDVDMMGVYLAPESKYIGIHGHSEKEAEKSKHIQHEQWDYEFHELRKFMSLLIKSNPNVIGMLWLKPELYKKITPTGRALIENRDIFSSQALYHSFTGYAYAQMHKMTHLAFEGYMGDKRKKLVKQFGYDCYLKDTEFLTDSGWKKFDDIHANDSLATVDIKTGDLIFCKYIDKIDKKYSGYLYTIRGNLSKCTVTHNHNLLVSTAHRNPKNNYSHKYIPNNEWELKSVDEILNQRRSHYHIRRCPNERPKELEGVSDDYLSLMGLFLSEGTAQFYRSRKTNIKKCKAIRLSQVKMGDFRDIINKLNYPIKQYQYKKETVYILHGPIAHQIYKDCGHGSKNKRLPKWAFNLSTRQVEILWKALLSGDGSKNKKGHFVYYSTNKNLIDDIQSVMILAGIPVAANGPYSSPSSFTGKKLTTYQIYRSKNDQPISCINFKKIRSYNKKPSYRSGKREGFNVIKRKVKNQRVVCFEVPTGTLITRQDGKVSIHGNCKNAAHCIRLLRMGIEFLETGVLNVWRNDASELLEIKQGKWSLEKVKDEAKKLFEAADVAVARTKLPWEADKAKANDICVYALKSYLLTGKIL